MRAAVLSSPRTVTVEQVPDPRIEQPTDAVVRVALAAVCGTDLRAFRGEPGPVTGPRCGHEFLGVVEEVGSEVRLLRPGQIVVAPFMFGDGDCTACRRGFPTGCRSGGMWACGFDGGQAEAVRAPFADAALVPVPVDGITDERLPAVLTLADVMATGLHAARPVHPGAAVAVVGDGAVGLCTALAARRVGAERVLLLGHHADRAVLGRRLGATDFVDTAAGTARDVVLEATGGAGVDVAVDCAGTGATVGLAVDVCADGGTVSIVGGPHGAVDPLTAFLRNISVTGGLTPALGYLRGELAAVLDGTLDPSPVFDLTLTLDDVAAAYLAMDGRSAVKPLLRVA